MTAGASGTPDESRSPASASAALCAERGSRWLPAVVLRCLLAAVLVIAGLKLLFT